MKQNLKNTNVENKIVLVREDFNVPFKDGVISDDNRIVAAKETIDYLISQKAKTVIFAHLGRVEQESDKEGKSLEPVAKKLSQILNQEVIFVNKTRGKELEDAIANMQYGDVLLVENTRFEDIDGKKESKNDPELGQYWASLGDVFVNDAFGMTHRAHASNEGIASYIKESCVGFLTEKELKMLGKGLDNPQRPFIAIIGGAKVSDKIGVIENMLDKADKIIIGGGMAYTFFKAQGFSIGSSLIEEDKVKLAKSFLEKGKGKIILPIDNACSKSFTNTEPIFTEDQNVADGHMGLDIGPKSITNFQKTLKGAKTIVWNGPMGVFEFDNFAKGTIAVCESIASLDDAFTVIGGGDSAAAAIQLGFKDKFSHISTGGGASLNYMEGKELIGLKSTK